jgi:hypothetical protein
VVPLGVPNLADRSILISYLFVNIVVDRKYIIIYIVLKQLLKSNISGSVRRTLMGLKVSIQTWDRSSHLQQMRWHL